MSSRAPRARPSVTRLRDECPWPDSLHSLDAGAWLLPGRAGSVLMFSPWQQVTAALGPSSTSSPPHTGSGGFQPAPRAPDAHLTQGSQAAGGSSSGSWLPGSAATSQRPGSREQRGNVLQLPPGRVLFVPGSSRVLREQEAPPSAPGPHAKAQNRSDL